VGLIEVGSDCESVDIDEEGVQQRWIIDLLSEKITRLIGSWEYKAG